MAPRTTPTPSEWARLIVQESRSLGVKMTPREIAEGVGVVQAESSGNAANLAQGPGGHIGAWSEEPSYGSTAQRLSPAASTRSAIEHWVSSGRSWQPDWGQYETGEEGGTGPSRYKTYLGVAEAALKGTPAASGSSSAGSSSPDSESSPEIFGDSLTSFGLVGVLVLGGFGLMIFGGTRVFGASRT